MLAPPALPQYRRRWRPWNSAHSWKAGNRFFRSSDDRFLLVEAGIQDHRHASQLHELLDHCIEARAGPPLDSLNARCPVDVDGCRNEMGLVGSDSRGERHERIRLAYLEIVGRMLRKHGRSERERCSLRSA